MTVKEKCLTNFLELIRKKLNKQNKKYKIVSNKRLVISVHQKKITENNEWHYTLFIDLGSFINC